jgi:hypothetical protein
MDVRLAPQCCLRSLPRRAVAPWLMLALICAVLGAAMVAAALATDTRGFAARHGTVLRTQAL